MDSRQIFALRKEGRSDEALAMARDGFRSGDDIWLLRGYAWALYDHVKPIVSDYEGKRLSSSQLSAQFSDYMREFARFGHRLRGDSAYSQMLRLAGKVSNSWKEFLGFACWAGIDHFPADDRKPYVNDDGKTIDSLQKRFVRAICKQTANNVANPNMNSDWLAWGQTVLDQALKNEPNDQWFNYYRSKVHLACGETGLAIECLAPVLRRQQRAAWPWGLLGEILQSSHSNDALTCYIHAVQLARKEQEVTKVRIRLSQLLARFERYGEAAEQARIVIEYRESGGYKLPQELQQLIASDWYRDAVNDNSYQTLPRVATEARALLQKLCPQELTYTLGVIDHINEGKALSYARTGTADGEGQVLLHGVFPNAAELLPGTIVEIGKAGPAAKPADLRVSDMDYLPRLCEHFSGTLEKREDQSFAFIRGDREDIFVPPALAKEHEPGRQYQVDCIAVRSTDKKGKMGWRVARFLREFPE